MIPGDLTRRPVSLRFFFTGLNAIIINACLRVYTRNRVCVYTTFRDSRDIIRAVINESSTLALRFRLSSFPFSVFSPVFLVSQRFPPYPPLFLETSACFTPPHRFSATILSPVSIPWGNGRDFIFHECQVPVIESDCSVLSSISITAPSDFTQFILEPVPPCVPRVRVNECLPSPMHEPHRTIAMLSYFLYRVTL